MSYIRAIGDPPRRSNAQLIADLAQLGYLPEPVLDMTYGLGRFWKHHRPEDLTTNDRFTQAEHDYDFTDLPREWTKRFQTAVFDPPYKLNGTSGMGGPASSDDDYGVNEYRSPDARHQLMYDGMTEAARVAMSYVIVKCMDQVVSGTIHFQTDLMTEHGKTIGLHKIDALYVYGYRQQPPGRRQVHAHRDLSAGLVFAVDIPPDPQLI